MYSDKPTINILTSLLLEHGVRHAVVCPGSRNAPICHNLASTGKMSCHPVTDERSAAFFAIGLSQALGMRPVAVCVTSGSALLDTSPAVAEAFYQRVPIVIIAADRPAAWIGQLDGQTLPQPDALGRLVRRAASLPMGNTPEELWHANRLINEALMDACTAPQPGPVLINVPLAEPLYEFNTKSLPSVRSCRRIVPSGRDVAREVAASLRASRRPMVVVGQTSADLGTHLKTLESHHIVVVREPLSNAGRHPNEAAYILNRRQEAAEDYRPDMIIYLGGHLVGKELKQFLRSCTDAETIMTNADGELQDVFQNATRVAQCGDAVMAETLAETCDMPGDERGASFFSRWEELQRLADDVCRREVGTFSQLQVLQAFDFRAVQYANSSAVRLGCLTAHRRFYCNRGVSGIDGSLSTASGFATGMESRNTEPSLVVIGDLSFFYDQNALWNNNLSPRLRILLLNNGGGGIFSRFRGLEGSPAREPIVMAAHGASARGVCEQFGVEYRSAADRAQASQYAAWLTADDARRPRLLEVRTRMDDDQSALDELYENLLKEYDERMAPH